ncbi:MAG TPA: flagellar biosynthetic protein FliR [Chitinispirillaceae bacterium]|nr:flagellar biosynthetic protein FliR [Chitinispirillaceae bacterium]
MTNLVPFSVDQIEVFILIFVRIITIIALLPVFGSESIPVQLKVGFSLLLSIILFNMIFSSIPQMPDFSWGIMALIVIKEILVGLAIGFAASTLFAAVQFAGRLIDTEMGFGMVQLFDPFSGQSVTVMGQFQIIVFTLLFLLFNGHYFFILAIQKSFEVIPLTGANIAGGHLVVQIANMVSNIFILAIKFSAPVFITLVLTSISLGVVARTVPQMNIFFVGLPLKIMVGLGATFIALPLLGNLFRKMVDALIQDIWRILHIMA